MSYLHHLNEQYLQHYVSLDEKYKNPNDIYTESMSKIKSAIREKACDIDNHYRFYIYSKMNPTLLPSPFLTCANIGDAITRFRCGSHSLPIETGRWRRIPRVNRLCPKCYVLGDESHVLFHCSVIPRIHHIDNDNANLSSIWKDKNIFKLFKELSDTELLKFH